jgi:hypothetical protein
MARANAVPERIGDPIATALQAAARMKVSIQIEKTVIGAP